MCKAYAIYKNIIIEYWIKICIFAKWPNAVFIAYVYWYVWVRKSTNALLITMWLTHCGLAWGQQADTGTYVDLSPKVLSEALIEYWIKICIFAKWPNAVFIAYVYWYVWVRKSTNALLITMWLTHCGLAWGQQADTGTYVDLSSKVLSEALT